MRTTKTTTPPLSMECQLTALLVFVRMQQQVPSSFAGAAATMTTILYLSRAGQSMRRVANEAALLKAVEEALAPGVRLQRFGARVAEGRRPRSSGPPMSSSGPTAAPLRT